MDMNEYQDATLEAAVYPDKGQKTEEGANYCMLGLAGEVGEVCNKWAKYLRRDPGVLVLREELGDCLWYLARLAAETGYSLSEVAAYNLEKLASRKARGVIRGSGDDR